MVSYRSIITPISVRSFILNSIASGRVPIRCKQCITKRYIFRVQCSPIMVAFQSVFVIELSSMKPQIYDASYTVISRIITNYSASYLISYLDAHPHNGNALSLTSPSREFVVASWNADKRSCSLFFPRLSSRDGLKYKTIENVVLAGVTRTLTNCLA